MPSLHWDRYGMKITLQNCTNINTVNRNKKTFVSRLHCLGSSQKSLILNPLKNFQNLLKNLKSCGEYLNAYDGSAPRFLKYVVWKIPLKRFVCVNICTSKHSRNIICWSLIVTFWEVLKPICKLHSSRLPLGDCAKLAEKELCTFPAFLRQQIKRKSLLLLGAQSAPPWFYRWD